MQKRGTKCNLIPLFLCGYAPLCASKCTVVPRGAAARGGDEGENATGRRFHPRSNENRELKERAMPRRATTIFSEGRQSGAEIVVFRPRGVCHTSEGGNGDSKGNRMRWQKAVGFQPQNQSNYEDAKKEVLSATLIPLFLCGYAPLCSALTPPPSKRSDDHARWQYPSSADRPRSRARWSAGPRSRGSRAF